MFRSSDYVYFHERNKTLIEMNKRHSNINLCSNVNYSLCVEVAERPPQMREVTGSITGWAIPKTLKLVVMATFLGAQGCGVSITTDWLVSG